MLATLSIMSFATRARSLLLSSFVSLLGCGAATPPDVDASDALAANREKPARRRAPQSELTPAEVVIKLRGNETEIRRCFFANPSARGTLSLSWHVNTEGRVEHVERKSSTLSDPRIEQCLAEKLSEVRFDPRADVARAGWTFVFRLVEPPKGRKRKLTKRDRDRAEDRDRGVELEKGSPGSLDLAAVDNVIESGYPLFARCYRDGVQRNSNLDGAVRFRLVVDETGQVTRVEDGGSDLTDRQVIDCVAEGFYALRFPEPSRGNAHLLYRIHFDAG